MASLPLALSAADLALSAAFTVLLALRWLGTRKAHGLLWAWAMLVWTVAVAAETAAAARGAWTPATYRTYYAFGALMVAAWLGAGSLHLGAPARVSSAATALVAVLSLAGLALIFTYPVNPADLHATDSLGFVDVSVFPFIPVRILVVVANIIGTLAFLGSALWSLWQFRRRSASGSRVAGLTLIAAGALVAASAHSLGALGGPGLFRVSELAAVCLIFSGYTVSLRPTRRPVVSASGA